MSIIGFRNQNQQKISFISNAVGNAHQLIHKNNQNNIQLINLSIINNDQMNYLTNIFYTLELFIKIDNPTSESSITLTNPIDLISYKHSLVYPYCDIVRLYDFTTLQTIGDNYHLDKIIDIINVGDVIEIEGEKMKIENKSMLPFQYDKKGENQLFQFDHPLKIYQNNNVIKANCDVVFNELDNSYSKVVQVNNDNENTNGSLRLVDTLINYDEISYMLPLTNSWDDVNETWNYKTYEIPYVASNIIDFKSSGSVLIKYSPEIYNYWFSKKTYPVSFKFKGLHRIYPQAFKLDIVIRCDINGISKADGEYLLLIFELDTINGHNYYKNYQFSYVDGGITKYLSYLPSIPTLNLKKCSDYTEEFQMVVWKDLQHVENGFEFPLYETFIKPLRVNQSSSYPLRPDIVNTNYNSDFKPGGRYYNACYLRKDFFKDNIFCPFIDIQEADGTRLFNGAAPVRIKGPIPNAPALVTRGILSIDEYGDQLGLMPFADQLLLDERKMMDGITNVVETANTDSYENASSIAGTKIKFVNIVFDNFYVISRNYDTITQLNSVPQTDIQINNNIKLYQSINSGFYKLNITNNKKYKAIQNMAILPGSSLLVKEVSYYAHSTYFEGNVINLS